MGAAIARLTHQEWERSPLWRLREIPEPPKTLYWQGQLPPDDHFLLSVVGSRKFTTYGRHVIDHLIGGLRGQPIGIVSGLAKGIDGLAHQAALQAGLYTLAIPGSGLDPAVLYPTQHRRLAQQILDNHGGLLSELEPTTRAAKWTFPQRNRLMAGVAHATLVIEAADRSGSLITARLATDYNRDLLAVPGSIFAPQSTGTNRYIAMGATPITHSDDILQQLGCTPTTQTLPETTAADTDTVTTLLHTLTEPMDLDTLANKTGRGHQQLQTDLMRLELRGYIYVEGGLYQRKI